MFDYLELYVDYKNKKSIIYKLLLDKKQTYRYFDDIDLLMKYVENSLQIKSS